GGLKAPPLTPPSQGGELHEAYTELQLRAQLQLVAFPPRDFLAALQSPSTIQVIAEFKRGSPSAGVMQAQPDIAAIARSYEQHGVACISVRPDGPYFKGSRDDLGLIRQTVTLPLLRKDFILDPYQVWEARLAGADAVLLIAEILNDAEMSSLLREIESLGM